MTKKESLILIEKQNGSCACIDCKDCVFKTCYQLKFGTDKLSCYSSISKITKKHMTIEEIQLSSRVDDDAHSMQLINIMKTELLSELSE